ncbi:hypothetical protein K3495_g13324 [Podosphaera aphanis]|nr:hypothetical protein K3495_g13324 [Podosphaera aphanis]
MSLTSSKALLPLSLAMMSFFSHTSSRLFSPDSNPIIHLFLKMSFYTQFCAGQVKQEIANTSNQLRSLGYSGIILCHAKETVIDQIKSPAVSPSKMTKESIRREITVWTKSVLATIDMVSPGDFVALKFSSAGSHTLYLMSKNYPPSSVLVEAVDSICNAASKRNVRLLIDAEQVALQKTLASWALDWMAKYNRRKEKTALIYSTYQAYLKATPSVISNHLKVASEGNFTLGVKLVRGAYLDSEPRHLIHDSKVETDHTYDNIAACLVRQNYGSNLKSFGNKAFPDISLVLATHNGESVRRILTLRKEQKEKGQKTVDLIYAQLQGMADEVGGELILTKKLEEGDDKYHTKPYKYLVWGTMSECMKYLLRRAQENRDAVQRTKEGKMAIWRELVCRIRRKTS